MNDQKDTYNLYRQLEFTGDISTAIAQVNGQWLAFGTAVLGPNARKGTPGQTVVLSLGRGCAFRRDRRRGTWQTIVYWGADLTPEGVMWAAEPSPNKAAAARKARRYGGERYLGEMRFTEGGEPR